MVMKQRSLILVSLLAIMSLLLAACDTGTGAQATAIPAANTAVSEAATAVAPAANTAVSEAATAVTGAGGGLVQLATEGITPDPTASGNFEFFSWWTAGGEADGKNDILNLYKQLYPGVNVIDAAVAGGGGDKAKAVLKTRMQGNDPPDTFQVHGGPELLDGYVKADKMEPITQLFTDMNMKSAFPQQLLDMITVKGEIYAVPSNVHRGNVLFYNKKVFADNNLKAPTTWDEFYTAAETLKGKGIAPLAVGGKDTWSVTMAFEDLLLAGGGADNFKSLMAGKTAWTEAHRRYLREIVLPHAAQRVVLEDALTAIATASERITRLEEQMTALLESWPMRPVVKALMGMRGFALVGAMVLTSELGGAWRFEHPRQLMAYLGLVPSEHTSSDKRRQGGITKTGNGHARWLMIEAAHHYRLSPKVSQELSVRQQGLSADVKACAWKAQTRLHQRTVQLLARGKQRNKVTVAVARELTGFVWQIFTLMAPRISAAPEAIVAKVVVPKKSRFGGN